MKTPALFFAAIFAGVLLFFSGCTQQPQGNGKYFEVAMQDTECQGNTCFFEVFSLDDGLTMVKMRLVGEDYKVSFCRANPEKQNELFSLLEQNLKENNLVECNGCRSLHVFYNNGKKSVYSSVPAKNAVFEKQFFDSAKQLCGAGTNAEFIHVVFGKNNKYSDYHIFSNNKIVFEKFGLKEGELLESKVSAISEKEFSEMKGLIPKEFFSSANTDNCAANGYFYGYIEAFVGGKYSYAFTCGSDNPAGTAFLSFAGRFSE